MDDEISISRENNLDFYQDSSAGNLDKKPRLLTLVIKQYGVAL